jgi:hypothetical protein
MRVAEIVTEMSTVCDKLRQRVRGQCGESGQESEAVQF